MELVEDHATRTTNAKSKRLSMNETDTTKSMTISMYSLGAKSLWEGETDDRSKRLDFFSLAEKEGGFGDDKGPEIE